MRGSAESLHLEADEMKSDFRTAVLRTGRLSQAFLGLFLMLVLSGCGEQASAGKSGVYVDHSTQEFLAKEFDATKRCSGFEEGNFEALSVVFMPPTFPCRHYASGCSGEYINPNHLKVGSLYVWRHEVIHYLLDLNTGDPDAAHKSPLFKDCI